MIRRALLALAGGAFHGIGGGARFLAGPFARAPYRPASGTLRGVAFVFEAAAQYALYLLGWIGWALDWIPRCVTLALAWAGVLPRGTLRVHGVLLLEAAEAREPALAEARRILEEAARVLEPHGIELSEESWTVESRARSLPTCGVRGMFRRSFPWLSARAPARAPAATVFFAWGLGRLAGCAFPGADWVLVRLGTDGTTLVHEIGHLADLWRHTSDPDNVMTDRPGGTHDRLTRGQASLLRSSRFVVAAWRPKRSTRRSGKVLRA